MFKQLLNDKNNTDDYFAIFEDDFFLLNEYNFINFITEFEVIKNENWGVITLTPRGDIVKTKVFSDNFNQIINNQTMTGYIIKKSFAKLLIHTLELGINKMLQGYSVKKYTCDQIWKQLQENHIFIYYTNIYGGQLPNWSNIENTNVDYNDRFIKQNNYYA
jgi:hypothetical protein